MVDERPLVAVVCSVPLVGEAVESALDFVQVRSFAERGDDISGLLHWLRPDVLVVDNEATAGSATPFAVERGLPIVLLGVRERTLRLFRNGEWELVGNGDGPTPDMIRNVVAGALFARERSVQ